MDRSTSPCPPSGGGLARLLVFALAGEAVGVILALILLQTGFGLAAALACVPACGGIGLLLAALVNALPRRRGGRAPALLSPTQDRNGM
jgi:hypothetical protein